MNAVVSLASSSIGQAITEPLFKSREILRICREHICPFYQARSRLLMQRIDDALADGPEYGIHLSEGAFFLWLHLPELSVTDRQLYEHLKQRGVLVVPGSYFFPGLHGPWSHRRQCIRISYGQTMGDMQRGIEILAEVVRADAAGKGR